MNESIVLPDEVHRAFCGIKNRHSVRFVLAKLSQDTDKWLNDNHYDGIVLYRIWYYTTKTQTLEWPKCQCCGKLLNTKQIRYDGIRKYCSRKCGGADKKRRNKATKTWLDKYGVDHPWKDPEIRKDIIATTNLRYGVDRPLQNPQLLQNLKDRNLRLYGYEMPFQNKDVVAKARETTLKKYGVTNIAHNPEILQKRTESTRANNYERYCEMTLTLHNVTVLSNEQQFINDDQLTFKCNKCGKIWSEDRKVAQRVTCPDCVHSWSTSAGERELQQYIKSIYNGEICCNNRSVLGNQEIDIYIPDLKLGFEFNGNWWHNELYCDQKYHLNKTNRCKEQGIRLIHILESNWYHKNEQYKKLIKKALNVDVKSIEAFFCCFNNTNIV